MAISEAQEGRVIEQLVGATLILQSKGALRISPPLVDDEGVDLVVGNRTNDKTLLLQIKGRFSLSGRGHYRTNVRRATCAPAPSKLPLFVYYDKALAALGDTCWRVRASDFCQLLSKQKATRPVYVFDSTVTAKADMWAPFCLPLKDTATAILKELK
jgi:hypothetical protein